METLLNEGNKTRVKLHSFGGYRHTDCTAPGEWYNMCNLSDRYFPLLSPRRSREVLATLYNSAAVHALILKKGFYLYATEGGAIHEAGAMEPIHVSESNHAYSFVEMGEEILAINGTDNGYLRYGKQSPAETKHWSFVPLGAYEVRAAALTPSGALCKPRYYYLTTDGQHRYTVTVKDAQLQTLSTNGISAGESFDTQAEHMLNIAFRYCVPNGGGGYTVLNITHLSTAQEVAAMRVSQYYISQSDKKLYRYDAPSGASVEITSPLIAVFIRNGIESDGNGGFRQTAPPEKPEQGDYVRLELGAPINLSHPYAWRSSAGAFASRTGTVLDISLRVLLYHAYTDTDNTRWNSYYGWQYYFIADYNAAFLDWICTNNMVHDTEHYSVPFEENSTASIIFSDSATEGEEVSASTLQLPESGVQKYYPQFIRLSRRLPECAAFIQHNNRIWGCTGDGKEIKASAQGKFTNWDDYRGLVSDSYTVGVGSDGAFTAAFALNNHLYFFKENAFTRVYGTRPANYCAETVCDGIGISTAGAASVQVIGGYAYYMGIDGKIYRFNGNESVCISEALGEPLYTVLSTAKGHEKYYLLLAREGQKHIYSYSLRTGMWFVEDARDIERILTVRGRACALQTSVREKRVGAQTYSLTDTQLLALEKWEVPAVEHNTVEWYAESGLIGFEHEYYQSICDLKITLESEVGAEVEVYIAPEHSAAFTRLAHFVSTSKQTKTVKIPLKRCRCMRLKLKGKGFSKIYAISYLSEKGSEQSCLH